MDDNQSLKLFNNFKLQLKESIWLLYPFDGELIDELITLEYPYVSFDRIWNHKNISDYWFFQNNEIKKEFEQLNIQSTIIEHNLDHFNIGRLLGFPPTSVKLFSNKTYNKSIYNKIGVNYCGMFYMSYIDSIVDDFIWLKENKKPPRDKNLDIIIKSKDKKLYINERVNNHFNFDALINKLILYTNKTYNEYRRDVK